MAKRRTAVPDSAPPIAESATGAATQQFAYAAAEDSPRRKALAARPTSEGYNQAVSQAHKRIGEGLADQFRNTELIGWAIRTHVAYVSQFRLHADTGVAALDRELERLFEWHAHPRRFDVARRHGRDEFLALMASCSLVDGDAASIWLPSGNAQLIPGRRIAKPSQSEGQAPDLPAALTDRGLVLDAYGAVQRYCVCRWNANGTGLVYDHMEDAGNVSFLAASWMDADQTRGMSPLAAALNRVRDSMTALEFTGLKMVMHSLLGLAFKGAPGQGIFPDAKGGTPSERKVDVANGLFSLELQPDESVDLLESKVPSSEFEPFMRFAIRLILLALDIPYVLFDSKGSSYSEHRAALNSYEFMADQKRASVRAVLDDYTDRRLAAWLTTADPVAGKARAIAEAAELDVRAVQYRCEWVPVATPWLDKLAEVKADAAAIACGLDSIPRAAKRHNVNPYELIAETGKVLAFAKTQGVPIYLGMPGQPSTEETRIIASEAPVV